MIVHYERDIGSPLTEEEKTRIREELKRARELGPTFDEDCPELSEAMLEKLKEAVIERNRRMRSTKA